MEHTHTELELLRPRALMIVINYLEGYSTKEANDASLKQLVRDYRGNQEEVKAALKRAFKYMLKERYIPDPDDPYDDAENEPRIPKKNILAAKHNVVEVLKQVWKKKKK